MELFFDLVFVFAVSQLSSHLLTYLSWRGAAETLVMLLAIFAVWFTTSWSATMIPVDQSRTRWLVLTVMLLGLFMNASVTRAFTTSGWAFVQGWYLWAVPNVRSKLHLIGGVALLLVGLATLAVPPYVALLLVGASVSTFAVLAR